MSSTEIQKKKKTELVTFRFDKETLENLRKDAKSKEISLNNLMGQIINQYTDWYSQAQVLGIIPMLDTYLKLILKDFSKSDIQKIVRDWNKKYREGMNTTCNAEITLELLIHSLEVYGKIAGVNFLKFETKEYTSITYRHNCGKNFSIFFSEIWLSSLGDLSKKVSTKISEQSLAFKILK